MVLFPEPFSTSDSQQQVTCPPFKGWSIFHCLKLPHLQGAGGNKTSFDLAKGKISEVKGQSEEFITAAKAAKIQAPDQKLPSSSACHAAQLPMCLEGAGHCTQPRQKTPISTHTRVLTPCTAPTWRHKLHIQETSAHPEVQVGILQCVTTQVTNLKRM